MESTVFQNPDLLKVWIWCLLKATHEDYDQLVGLTVVKLKAGQFVTGRIKAAEELKMSENKFYRNMKTLTNLGMLTQNPNSKYTLVTVGKWALYQCQGPDVRQQIDRKQTASRQQVDTNNNSNNNNNNNNMSDAPTPKVKKVKHGEFGNVLMTPDELGELEVKLGKQTSAEYIRRLDEYIGTSGKRYKSHYLTILTWERRDKETGKPGKAPKKEFDERVYDYSELEKKLLGRE